MVAKIFIGMAAVLAVLVAVIAMRPDTFHIERSVSIAAPPERAYSQVDDFHQWSTWSPWEKLDPDMKRSYSGAPSGTGAGYGWTSTGKAGEGRMTIEDATAPSKISIRLEFVKPFPATNQATFTFTPTPSGTTVVWAMDGKNGFMSKAFSLVANVDKLVGGDFEKGLAAMKANAERGATTQAAVTN
ncbi:MAG TPA: SRPBCC family protein [Polyangiaceae bacterium]|jgi:uncharacterized protein YndB with AHSA1/START domain|nr:SRPBCC family protein [Polyangiaceae bacterium]